ncbi:MAG: phage major capsid protein [Holdemanella porci]
MCGSLNEMDLKFNNIEMDGYAVAGFFAVCNAVLEDSDEDLATEIINAIGKAIGKALDKAIVFGHGVKMPLGIVTRLAQKTRPNDYPSTARSMERFACYKYFKKAVLILLEKNCLKISLKNPTCVINDYSSAGLTWVMNEKTHKLLMAESLDADMNECYCCRNAEYNAYRWW